MSRHPPWPATRETRTRREGPDLISGRLPRFWRPVCPHCEDTATHRLAMGDERGPFQPAVGVVTCDTCGGEVELDAASRWSPFHVEDGSWGTS